MEPDSNTMSQQHEQKRQVAIAAADTIEEGMKVGLGTGSTADLFVDRLGERVAAGLKILGVPTSERTAMRAKSHNIPLATLDESGPLDVVVDGADEIDPDFRLIKGAGGALLREKIVACAAPAMVVIADASKLVPQLGAFPLPIEVNPFASGTTLKAIERAASSVNLSGDLKFRQNDDETLYVTDGQHYIVDGHFNAIPDPEALAAALDATVGVVEHGLFLNMASTVYVSGDGGVRRLDRKRT